MRKLLRFLLPASIVAFFIGVAGAAAAPYYGAVTTLMHNATARLPVPHAAAPSPTPLPTGAGDKGGHLPTPTATATRTTPKSHATPKQPTQQVLAAEVQHLARTAKLPHRRINILILGSDNDQKFASYSDPLTQVIIVLSVDPVNHSAIMLSIPRDFWVHIPGYKYNTGPDGSIGWSKIDVASKLGFDSTACTVERNFGIPIDHWVWVGLNGFIKVIDSLGGVTLDVTHPVIDDTYPDDLSGNPYAFRRIYIPPGPQHLLGDAALHFVRSRHGDVLGDFGRSSRQQILLSQLRRMLQRQDAASLVALMPQLMQDFQHEIKTDITPDFSTVSSYWALLRSLTHGQINQLVLSPPYSTGDDWVYDYDPDVMATNGGQPVYEDAVAPNWPLINAKITQLFGGQDTSAPHCALVAGAS